jgi:excisionase family DNA binding protein
MEGWSLSDWQRTTHEGPNNGICAAEAGLSHDLPTRPRVVGAVAFETPREDHHAPDAKSNIPMTVKDAARFLGVSPQTVYLWVERRELLLTDTGIANRFRVSLPCLRRWRFEKRPATSRNQGFSPLPGKRVGSINRLPTA